MRKPASKTPRVILGFYSLLLGLLSASGLLAASGLLTACAQAPQAASAAPQSSTPPTTNQAASLGPFAAHSFNFSNHYGAHRPFQFHILDSTRVSNNDLFGGVSIDRTILSGSENFLAPEGHRLDCGGNGCSLFQNALALQLRLVTHSPMQIGGMIDGFTRSYAPGDSISLTFENRYTGVSRGTDEGAHLLRAEVTPVLHRWGGTIQTIAAPTDVAASRTGTDSNSDSNVGVTVSACPGCALDASAEGGAPIINLSRPMPLGNVARVQVYAPDPRFIVLTLGDSGKPLPASHWTSLTAPVDSRVDGANCASDRTPAPKVQWPPNDPFLADAAGHGNATAQHCFSVASTSGLVAGTVVVIGGDGPEIETTKVVQVVDRTHFIANARMPHPGPTPVGVTPPIAGDAVTWGGLAGYAAGFVADTVAPRGMTEQQRQQNGWSPTNCDFNGCNTTPLYLTPLVMASLPGNQLVVYIDFEAASHTLNTFGLMSNQPRRPARLSAKVVHGQVVSLTTLATGDYRQLVDPQLGVNSGQTRLPPPAITLPGCRVQPILNTSLTGGNVTDTRPDRSVAELGAGLIVHAQLDPQHLGQGCPNGDAVPLDVQAHYANPLIAYPAALVYRAIRPGEQREDLNSAEGYQLWMPPTGQFHVGDNVLASTWPLQFVGDIQSYGRNLGFNSDRQGPFHRWLFRGQGNRQPMIDIMDQTTPYRFYSDQAHGFAATADGGGMTEAPSGISFTGAYTNIFQVLGPPRRDVDGTPGAFVDFACYSGSTVDTLCAHNVLNAFDLFSIEPVLGGPANQSEQHLRLDPQHHRWEFKLNARDGVISSDAALEAPALRLGVGGCTGCTLSGETAPIGGAPLAPGQCATGSTHVEGAILGSPVVVSASDGSLPGGEVKLDAAVTAPATITVEVCAIVRATPPQRRYQVRVVP